VKLLTAACHQADTALRLSRYFGSTPEFWINLQAVYDLSVTIDASAHRIEREFVRAKLRELLVKETHRALAVAIAITLAGFFFCRSS